jgi:hypothetical protein
MEGKQSQLNLAYLLSWDKKTIGRIDSLTNDFNDFVDGIDECKKEVHWDHIQNFYKSMRLSISLSICWSGNFKCEGWKKSYGQLKFMCAMNSKNFKEVTYMSLKDPIHYLLNLGVLSVRGKEWYGQPKFMCVMISKNI